MTVILHLREIESKTQALKFKLFDMNLIDLISMTLYNFLNLQISVKTTGATLFGC